MCIWIINYQPGDVVRQPIIQLFGFDSIYNEKILVNDKYQWPIVQGLFKVYIELNPGENIIQMSTSTSEISFKLIYSPDTANHITIRLVHVSFDEKIGADIEHICKKFTFLTKLVRCTFDEILYKQTGYQRSLLFNIERKFHNVSLLRKDFEEKMTTEDIFKETYRQIHQTDLVEDPSIKLIIESSISPSLTFAYTFNNIIVFNLPKQFASLPSSFDEFYENLITDKFESLSYSVGAYLHELGHLFGLDHGTSEIETIMSSSKCYVDAGKDFFLISPRLRSIIFNHQCSCYKKPVLNLSCSYSNGLFSKYSTTMQSLCKSDSHCQFSLKFNYHKYNEKPNQCVCNGQYQFELNHCHQLLIRFNEAK